MPQRDDFSEAVKRALAARVAYLCSNPECRAPTSGPHEEAAKAINLGVGAHITAAAPGGPRYDAGLTSEQRSSAENALWLCATCAKLIDSDPLRFPVTLLRDWKAQAEAEARAKVGKTAASPAPITSGSTFNLNIQNSTIAGLALGDRAKATGSISMGSSVPSVASSMGGSAPTPASSPTVDWDVSTRTRTRITELLKDAQPHLGARKSHTWGSTLSGTKIPVWLIQGADKILRQDEGVSVPGFYETPAEVCDVLHGDVFMSYLAACSKYLTQVTQAGTHYQYMPPAEFEHRVNTILADDDGFARRATLRDGQWLVTSRPETARTHTVAGPQALSRPSGLQSVYLSYAPADEPFMERLFHALEARGVATFFFPEHAPVGVKFGRVARVGINQHDRVVLLCSRVSLADPKVQNDLEQTLEREAREGGSSRLIPVNLDNFARSPEWQPPHPDVIHEIQGRVMVEMVGAERDAKTFEQGIEKLIRALKG